MQALCTHMRLNLKTKNSRREVTAYELRFDYKRREKTFFLALFCLLKQLQWQFKQIKKLNELKKRGFI